MNRKFNHHFFVVLGLFAYVMLACNSSAGAEDATTVEPQDPVFEQTVKEEPQEVQRMPMLISEEQYKQLVADFTSKDGQFKGEKPCVVDFYADWCRPCRMLAPTFEAMAGKYGDKVNFYKVDVDNCRNIAAAYNITGIPTLFFYDKAGTLYSMTGMPSEEELENAINAIIQ